MRGWCVALSILVLFVVYSTQDDHKGVWGPWEKQECKGDCGEKGKRLNTRECLEGNCKGRSTKTSNCQMKKCKGPKVKYGDWYSVGCNPNCGKAKDSVETFKRDCLSNGVKAEGCVGRDTREKKCKQELPACGKWSSWRSNEDGCSVTCGKGTKTMVRVCQAKQPDGSKKDADNCEGESEMTEECEKKKCKEERDANWGEWKVREGKSCEGRCGEYNAKYERECIGGKAGKHCPGEDRKEEACEDLPPCASWTEWVEKGKCSEKCGEGKQKFKRKCDGKGKYKDTCPGDAEKEDTCNLGACAAWTEWEAGDCSASCGAGEVESSRTCEGIGKCDGDDSKTEACNKGDCAGWGEWKAGDCSATCGDGTVKSTRECTGLGDCAAGDAEKTEDCNKGDCAAWGEWKAGACSATCGDGTVKSTRECTGLGDCAAGDAEKTEDCNEGDCASKWGDWVKEGGCSVTCGSGVVQFTRECLEGDCSGDATKTEECSRPQCGENVCSGHGDPHYTTYDGKKFDFMGTCRYSLSGADKDAVKKNKNLEPFSVDVENKNIGGNKAVSYLKTVWVTVHGVRFRITNQEGRREVLVDGEAVHLPFSLPDEGLTVGLSGIAVHLTTKIGLTVKVWTYSVEVRTWREYNGVLTGLCGNMDGDAGNDFGDAEDANEFGSENKLPDDEQVSECIDPPDPEPTICELMPEVKKEFEEMCAILKGDCFKECAAKHSPNSIYDDCVFDLCATMGEKSVMVDAVENYAQTCQTSGFKVCFWREIVGAIPQCGDNQEWVHEGSACPNTCVNEQAADECNKPDVEGCQCKDGFVMSGDECVKATKCGCKRNGKYVKSGETLMSRNCDEVCTCVGQEFECKDHSCPANMVCGRSKKEKKRMCLKPAAWTTWVGEGCDVECGDEGEQIFTRECEGHGRCEGGKKAGIKVEECDDLPACAAWTEWVSQGCSVTCGDEEGTEVFKRTCEGHGECPFWTKDTKEKACGGILADLPGCAGWSEWAPTGECSVTCGTGTISYTRTCVGVGSCGDGATTKTEACPDMPACGSSTCLGHGDPHYRNFKGQPFDFQGICRYYLVKTIKEQIEGKDYLEEFAVEVENQNLYGNTRVSLLKQLWVYVGDQEIRMMAGRQVDVDGVRTTLPYTNEETGLQVFYSGADVRLKTRKGLEVRYNGQWNLYVYVWNAYTGCVSGLCGAIGGAAGNHFGGVSINEFGRRQKVPNIKQVVGCVDPDPPVPTFCDKVPAKKVEFSGEKMCGILNGDCFAECRKHIPVKTAFDNCVFDLCLYDNNPKSLLVDAIQEYSSRCQEAGHKVCFWREIIPEALPDCPANAEWVHEGTACPNTCVDETASENCDQPKVEGCQCKEGFVMSGDECVKSEKCGCRRRGKYYKSGARAMFKDCTLDCTCVGQEFQCKDTSCTDGQVCGRSEVHRAMMCLDPAAWTTWAGEGCNSNCGTGKEKFRRVCEGYGKCEGGREASMEKRDCVGLPKCAEWTAWAPFSCSIPCGEGGVQTWKRYCEGWGVCGGDDEKESEPCVNLPKECGGYLGCFRWSNAQLRHAVITSNDMTIEMCKDHCASFGGYKFYGVWSRTKCGCDRADFIPTIGKVHDSHCDDTCMYDEKKGFCGGSSLMSLYDVSGNDFYGLGMERNFRRSHLRQITDNQLSSSAGPTQHKGTYGAIAQRNTHLSTVAWEALAAEKDSEPWVQVDFLKPQQVNGVITRGRKGSNRWVTKFTIMHGNDADKLKYMSGKKMIFEGNSEANNDKFNVFPVPIKSRFVRLVVLDYNTHPSLKWELFDDGKSIPHTPARVNRQKRDVVDTDDEYIGCFADAGDRDFLTQGNHNPNSAKICRKICLDQGHRYYAMAGAECRCASSPWLPYYGKLDDEKCVTKCPGNTAFICGGGVNINSVYDSGENIHHRLGIEVRYESPYNQVAHEQLDASSEYNPSTYSTEYLRLNYGSSYLAATLDNPRKYSWVQVDMLVPKRVTGVVMRGRGNANDFTKNVKFQYGSDPQNLRYIRDEDGNEQIFPANENYLKYNHLDLPEPITTRYFRIELLDRHSTYKAISFDLYNDGRPADREKTWSTWKAAGACSATCGGGEMTFRRSCSGDVNDCLGPREQTRACNTKPCGAAQKQRRKYLGCFMDGTYQGKRDLAYSYITLNTMTIETCEEHCVNNGYQFFGLQGYTQCYCGRSDWAPVYGRMEEKDCNYKCRGNAEQMCGGSNRNSVYDSGSVPRRCPLGLEEIRNTPFRKVSDGGLMGSSMHSTTYGELNARLNSAKYGWMPNAGVDQRHPFITAYFDEPITASGVITQGRSNADSFVKKFTVLYGDDHNSLMYVEDANGEKVVFEGNTDRNTEKYNTFPYPIKAKVLRIAIVTDMENDFSEYHNRMIHQTNRGLRFDFFDDCTSQPVRGDSPPKAMFTGKRYIGCFQDTGTKDLAPVYTTSATMDVDECMKDCNDKGYVYFGIQAGRYCYCAGANWVSKYARLDDDKCATNCVGLAEEKCGASNINSIYMTGNGRKCHLGMEVAPNPQGVYKHIGEPQITSSSEYSAGTYGRRCARLNCAGAWMPNGHDQARGRSWVQVDFLRDTLVHGIIVQGRSGAGWWTTKFAIHYGQDIPNLKPIVDEDGNELVFDGNTDYETYTYIEFPAALKERYYRVVNLEYVTHMAIRFEFWNDCSEKRIKAEWTGWTSQGCDAECGKEGKEIFTRTCIGFGNCPGDDTKEETCERPSCESSVPEPNGDPSYIGCFFDTGTRDLAWDVKNSGTMTVQECHKHCVNKGHHYFGLQYGSYCYCGGALWKPKYYKTYEKECNTKCRGNADQICGGNARNSVYEAAVTRRCALGMERRQAEHRQLTDDQISASSENSATYSSKGSRLRGNYGWIPGGNDFIGGWMQVDFRKPTKVSGIITQGRSNGANWVTNFAILYGDTLSTLKYIKEGGKKKNFFGNSDQQTIQINDFPAAVTARYIRIAILGYHGAYPTLRFELYDDCPEPMPQTGYLGCFTDSSVRDLNQHYIADHTTNTAKTCEEHCTSKGHYYYSTQASYMCWCEHSEWITKYNKVDDKECNYKCKGDENEMCGGSNRNSVYGSGENRLCHLGMESRLNDPFQMISLAEISSSSEYSAGAWGRMSARLNTVSYSWLANGHDQTRGGAFLQVDLLRTANVAGVITQGRYNVAQWTKAFEVHYGDDSANLKPIMDGDNPKVFEGNTDYNNNKYTTFPEVVKARFVRIVVREYQAHAALRIELFENCPAKTPAAKWTEWVSMGCNAKCGEKGVEVRKRACVGYGNCKGNAIEEQECEVEACSKPVELVPKGTPGYLGCFIDTGTRDLDMLQQSISGLTHEKCREHCVKQGYQFYAMQQTYCRCARAEWRTKYGRTEESECNYKCQGNAEQICGGSSRNSVYDTNGIRRCSLGLEKYQRTKGEPGWRQVADEQLVASSEHPAAAWSVKSGRLNQPSGYAWVGDLNDPAPWIQVDFKKPTQVMGIKTQGRSNADWRVTQFSILFGNSLDNLNYIKKNGQVVIFEGNQDRVNIVLHDFENAITARFVRIVVKSYNQYPAMRFELFDHCPEIEFPEAGYLGCYQDASVRDLPQSKLQLTTAGATGMTNEKCEKHCLENGHSYYATSYYYICYCAHSNWFPKYYLLDDAKCNLPCKGDADQMCGGSNINSVYATGKNRVCHLGMELPGKPYSAVALPEISSSSEHSVAYGRQAARLNHATYSWLAGGHDKTRGRSYVQVDLLRTTQVNGVITQGRANANQYTTAFEVHYGTDAANLKPIADKDGNAVVFEGNTDYLTHKYTTFDKAVNTRFVRIVITEYFAYPALQFEVFQNCPEETPAASWADWVSMGCKGVCGEKGVEVLKRTCVGHGACEGDSIKEQECEIEACSAPVDLTPKKGTYAYMGCFFDASTRDLDQEQKSIGSLTIDVCAEHCALKGYQYFAMQQTYCRCARADWLTIRGRVTEAECNYKCQGNSEQMCGGSYRNSVYDLQGTRRCGLGLEKQTGLPQNGWNQLTDSQFQASSEYSAAYKASNARFNLPTYAWVPDINDKSPWIQVDLEVPRKVTGIKTQGRPNVANEWTTQYAILYGNSLTSLNYIKKDGKKVIFQGNSGRYDTVVQDFPAAITARYVRVVVLGMHDKYPALRFELLDNCPPPGPVKKTGYLGCYQDAGFRDLPMGYVNTATMTNAECIKNCKDKGYAYAATSSSSQCWCHDSNYVPRYQKLDDDKCSYKCRGNQEEFCGASNINSVYAVDGAEKYCSVGMRYRMRPQEQVGMTEIAASSIYSTSIGYNTRDARLNERQGSWIASSYENGLQRSWLQVDLLRTVKLKGIIVQGRGNAAQWVKKFQVHYGEDSANLKPIMDGNEPKMFDANTDHINQVSHVFKAAINARIVRLFHFERQNFIAMRFDLMKSECETGAAEWAAWKSVGCDATCDEAGVETFRRTCVGYGTCAGSFMKTETCAKLNCGVAGDKKPKGTVKYLGCFIDAGTRDLKYAVKNSATMTTQECREHCVSNGYKFFATQASSYCYCGKSDWRPRYGPAVTGDAECNYNCRGNAGQKCGGSVRNSVYDSGEEPICQLGMERTGGWQQILDSQIKASSVESSTYTAVLRGRLRHTAYAWRPGATDQRNSYIEIDFGKPTQISGVMTQGNVHGNEWVTSYAVLYGDRLDDMKYIGGANKQLFAGNFDRNSISVNRFNKPITARYVRVVVLAYELRVAMRIDFFNNCPEVGVKTGYVGCYQDTGTRDLPFRYKYIAGNNNAKCSQYCQDEGFYYSGTTGYHYCYCAPSNYIPKYNKLEEASCSYNCAGVAGEKCGASNINSVTGGGKNKICHLGTDMSAPETPLEDILAVKMSASTEYSAAYAAWRGRLNLKNGNGGVGAWLPTGANFATNPWIQVDYGKAVGADGVVTQGRDGVGYWTKTYEVHYGNGANSVKSVGKLFTGNTDYWTPKYLPFGKKITARYWRIVVKSYHGHPTLRFDMWKYC